MEGKKVVVGCFSGFWGDSVASGARQLVEKTTSLDYLVGDFLAEVTMGILARLKSAPRRGKGGMGEGGYVAEFVDTVWKPLMKQCLQRNIKIITNAGGMNPEACKAAIEKVAQEAGLTVKVAAISGDDLLPKLDELRTSKSLIPFQVLNEQEEIPEDKMILSCNAYTGAFPIARALDQGAQVVVTGRCVDSALVVGPLIHEFKWKSTEYDLLAAGSVAGHVLECGCHATGGNFTDWKLSQAAGWDDVGFPLAEFYESGKFVVTKPANTGGIVTKATLSEQIVYEIHDPAEYILPDVVVDFTQVKLTELPAIHEKTGRVLVEGAKGYAPTPFYKVCCTYFDGYKSTAMLMIGGIEAKPKALAVADAILKRTRRSLKQRQLDDFLDTNVEVLGSEHSYGPHSRVNDAREVLLRISVWHNDQQALEIFSKEVAPSALAMAPGITGSAEGRPRPTPQLQCSSALVKKELVPVSITVNSHTEKWTPIAGSSYEKKQKSPTQPQEAYPTQPTNRIINKLAVPLISICYGRSGDKGDVVNIGVIARNPQAYPYLKATLTAKVVKEYMSHIIKGKVERYELPGIFALNFVCTKSLGGGGLASLQMDRQGKSFAQMLLSLPVVVPTSLLYPKL